MDFLRQIHLDTKRIFFPFGVAAPFSIYQMIATTTCTTCKGKKKGFSFLLLFLLLRRKWLAVCDAQVFFLCVQLCVGWGCCHLGWASRFVFGIDVKTMQKGRSILSLGCGQGCQCVASRKENRREETIDWSLMRQPRLNQDDNNQKKKRHCSLQRSKVLLDLFLLLSISFSFFLSRQLPLSTEKKNNNIFFSQFFLFLILLRSFPSGFLLSHPYSCYDLSARKEFSHVSFQSSPLNKDKFVQPGVTCLLPIELVFTPTKSLEKGKIISKAK